MHARVLVAVACLMLGGLAASGTAHADDLNPATVTGHLPVPTGSTAVAIDPSGERAYVAVTSRSTLLAIDLATRQVLWEVPVGRGPQDVVVSADGTLAYTANSRSRSVSVVRLSDGSTVRTIPVKKGANVLALATNGARLWVEAESREANLVMGHEDDPKYASTISVVDPRSGRLLDAIVGGSLPRGLILSPSGSRAYQLSWGSRTIRIYNAKKATLMSTLATRPWPDSMALNPAGSRLLVAHSIPGARRTQPVTTVNTAKREITGVFLQPFRITTMAINVASLDFGDVYAGTGKALVGVTGSSPESLVIIDLVTQKVLSTTDLEDACTDGLSETLEMALSTSASRAVALFECLDGSGALSVIDLRSSP